MSKELIGKIREELSDGGVMAAPYWAELLKDSAQTLESQAREIERHAEVVRVESELRTKAEQHLTALKAQPDPWKASGADCCSSIHRNPDAKDWADFFVAVFPGQADKHELMTGWFANAMMAMHDHLKAQPSGVVHHNLIEALKFYANGDHLLLADPDAWDTCSGEPINFLHDDAGTASVEDGSIAKVALDGLNSSPVSAGHSLPADWEDLILERMNELFSNRAEGRHGLECMVFDDTQVGVEFACKQITEMLGRQLVSAGEHVPDAVFQDEFKVWWEEDGQYVRSGGGDYERTFAFQAWRHLYPMLMQARAALSANHGEQVRDRLSIQVCKLGRLGAAYDPADTRYAYTYAEQPDNTHAWRLGKAFSATKPGGDYIDAGLSLLKQLEKLGFGVFQLAPTPSAGSQKEQGE